ncbi:membrane protein [Burkholderia lata]|uniref:Membrane protein n=1 Tax=Burkholderia lata (strain ATCC 17760 / DSM 23089 / LMG 22485 / NCIMB 9086 / R18194 / 383) TaxID=482957 RepID=A0A6P2R674_BURL3|nr:membrane protein [Burkholderia lata]VWC28281.1 membrane protein [Burkholderia lata]VWC42490.1 membrane protein [Burkholderia lata]
MPFRTVVILAAAAIVLAGCVVVPARPAYYRPARVVVY